MLKTVLIISIFHIGLYGPPLRSNGTRRVQFLLEGSIPVFLRKHILATCDFPGGSGPTVRPLDSDMLL